jgi:ribosomal RNA-processing protein 36
MQRPVQLRHDLSDEDDFQSHSRTSESEVSSSEASRDLASSDESLDDHGRSDLPDDENGYSTEDLDGKKAEGSSLKNISFGVLAEAQERFRPKSRKRKLPVDFGENEKQGNGELPQIVKQKEQPRSKPARPSKHAPTVLSSKQQVSRRRDVFEPSSAARSRDPRFDPTVQASNHDRNAVEKANKNYSFLTAYQAAEIHELKAQIKKTKDPGAAADLKRRVMAIENKVRSVEATQRERQVMKQHKQKEKEMIRTGQKSNPYYLKPSEVKKLADNERLENMGKKARDKAIQRKQKREKSKEARLMPRVRRE